jgi:DNA repair protein RecO
MHYSTAEAILLDVVSLHEFDRIVEFLTAEAGRKRGVARGARRKFSRFAGQLQPLSRVRVGWHEKEGRDLVRIDSVELLQSAELLQSSLEGILLGSYLAEHMMVFVQENESEDLYYRLFSATLDALRDGADHQLVARYFECWVLRLAGVFPAPLDCPGCGRSMVELGAVLDLTEGALFCRDCLDGGPGFREISRSCIEFLLRIGSEKLASMAARSPSLATLSEIEGLAGRIRRHFLQHELKSYDVMQRTLAALR